MLNDQLKIRGSIWFDVKFILINVGLTQAFIWSTNTRKLFLNNKKTADSILVTYYII